jgi:DNA-binding response OmpR family regulator
VDTVALRKPDMAIVDLSLPGIGKIEVIRHIRTTSATYLLPILVLTANRYAAAADAAMGAGSNSVMTKSSFPEQLVARVDQVLRENQF